MRIHLDSIGKKFNSEWVFRNVGFSFEPSSATAILGRNGSGKSTLLQIIAGCLSPSSGNITYTLKGKNIPPEEIFRHLAMLSPGQDLIEEFTLKELLSFHFSLKKILPAYSTKKAFDLIGSTTLSSRPIRQFSSGMKQRVKLILTLLSDVPLLLLDEPATNLDVQGIEWYLQLIDEIRYDRTLIICSNQHQKESAFTSQGLQLDDYKG